jgi:hypothetical protein
MAAMVLDFPLPVGPVIKIRPEGLSISLLQIAGKFNCSMVEMPNGISLTAMLTEDLCCNTLTLHRVNPGML